jgi:hypothetical protein
MQGRKDGWFAHTKGNKGKPGRSQSGHPVAKIEAELAEVRAAAPAPRIEDPIYRYLQSIYRLRCKVETSPELQAAIKSEHEGRFPKTKRYYAGVIIELTAPHVTSKMKHKYVSTIEYAFRQGVETENFVDFVKEQGGINKCCELWLASNGGQRRGNGGRSKAK